MPNAFTACGHSLNRADLVDLAKYQVTETLRNGGRVNIRALRADDRDGLLAAVASSSTESLYRRFFAPKRSFTDKEVAFFLNVDFVQHLALVAVLNEPCRPTIVGGTRCIVGQHGKAEVAFAVVDDYQRQGMGALLMRHLATIARRAGINELVAEVLADNRAMLRVFEKSGLPLSEKREAGVVYVSLQLS
jgi:GNAT superfamily N-acetyltransferase